MKKLLIFLLFILLMIAFYNCGGGWRRPLSLQRKDYNGAAIRMQGFYYSKKYWNFFLYKNGVVLGKSAYFLSLEQILHCWRTNGQDTKWLNNSASGWGIYQIDYPNIVIEQWYDADSKGSKYPTKIMKGNILNDSTMILERVPFGRDTFYFHYLPVKPDSTNRFIK